MRFYIKNKYLNDLISDVKADALLKIHPYERIKKLCEKVCELFDTNFDTEGYLGIAIAGYGENELYPSLYHLHFNGMINNKLRFHEIKHYTITDENDAIICPLAQTDVMKTFIEGINNDFISDLNDDIPKEIKECLEGMNTDLFLPGKKEIIYENLCQIKDSIIKHLRETINNQYVKPILDSVSFLPFEELALLAESMINITSLRRKVIMDQYIGTVGGPIDVAVVSKGDGFIWIKRKHYFDKQYNPQYFYSHYTNLNNGILNKQQITGNNESEKSE